MASVPRTRGTAIRGPAGRPWSDDPYPDEKIVTGPNAASLVDLRSGIMWAIRLLQAVWFCP